MKFEKINDNQIKCTLNRNDLQNREIKLSELAYGTEKAQQLFKDMMEQASFEFGFDYDNVPLMIEAIPLASEGIILIITKVENPDELDNKLSSFSSSLKRFNKRFSDYESDLDETTDESDINYNMKNTDLAIFCFNSIDEVCLFGSQIFDYYTGLNSLYKNTKTDLYYLVLHRSDFDTTPFDSILSVASEYGIRNNATYATESNFIEHYDIIIKNKATQVLAKI